MEPLKIEGSEFTPSIILDAQNHKLEIVGESRPENAGKFYEPVIKWLEQYQQFLKWQKEKGQAPGKVTFLFSFEYFNSTSAKYILDIFKQLDNCHADMGNLAIKWQYDALDEDMKDSGEEFSKLIKVPFEFNAKEE